VADLQREWLVVGFRQAARPQRQEEAQARHARFRRSRQSRLHRGRAKRVVAVDITEHWTSEGKLYLCAIKDCFSNKIVGYSIDSRRKARLAVAALENAVARRRVEGAEVAGCILHADRGSQFRSRKFHRTLSRHGLVGSMGQVASAADNAAMESFFSLLQKNVLDRRPWRTREQLRIAIVTWIERTYHRRRRQDTGSAATSSTSSGRTFVIATRVRCPKTPVPISSGQG
jgi:transposase InsO family protein